MEAAALSMYTTSASKAAISDANKRGLRRRSMCTNRAVEVTWKGLAGGMEAAALSMYTTSASKAAISHANTRGKDEEGRSTHVGDAMMAAARARVHKSGGRSHLERLGGEN